MQVKIKIKRGLELARQSYTPDLGELVFTTDEKKLYIGDGETLGGILISSEALDSIIQQLSDLENDLDTIESDLLTFRGEVGDLEDITTKIYTFDNEELSSPLQEPKIIVCQDETEAQAATLEYPDALVFYPDEE